MPGTTTASTGPPTGDLSTAARATVTPRRAVVLLVVAAITVGVVVWLLAWLLVTGPVAAAGAGLVVAVAVAATAWWGSVPLALRLAGGHPAHPVDHARLLNLVEGLGANAGVTAPSVLVRVDPALNALTLGRSSRQATLVVTSGLLEELNRIELEAVVAHELSHIRSDDLLAATLAVPLFGIWRRSALTAAQSGPSAILARLLVPVSALAGLGLRLSVDPHREEQADIAGVRLTRYPPALMSALEKVRQRGPVVDGGNLSPATAHLWLASPLPPSPRRLAWLTELYETHPGLQERIEALREL
ncbi:MAG TPA: M48 family metalloprotease [Acidimicrobiales bacterium]|nr:M48 family metalloprotease [Acidimicrobiales bacterium]